MRADKLARQLRAHHRAQRRNDTAAQQQLAAEIADIDQRIARLIDALETGLDADQVRQRLRDLQEAKERAQADLRTLTPVPIDPELPDASELLERIPDLSELMRDADPKIKRRLFDAFGLQITYDKAANKVHLSATISEQLAQALADPVDLAATADRRPKPGIDVIAAMKPRALPRASDRRAA